MLRNSSAEPLLESQPSYRSQVPRPFFLVRHRYKIILITMSALSVSAALLGLHMHVNAVYGQPATQNLAMVGSLLVFAVAATSGVCGPIGSRLDMASRPHDTIWESSQSSFLARHKWKLILSTAGVLTSYGVAFMAYLAFPEDTLLKLMAINTVPAFATGFICFAFAWGIDSGVYCTYRHRRMDDSDEQIRLPETTHARLAPRFHAPSTRSPSALSAALPSESRLVIGSAPQAIRSFQGSTPDVEEIVINRLTQ